MVSGSVLSWLALIPLRSILVPEATIKADLLKLGFTQGLCTLLVRQALKALEV